MAITLTGFRSRLPLLESAFEGRQIVDEWARQFREKLAGWSQPTTASLRNEQRLAELAFQGANLLPHGGI